MNATTRPVPVKPDPVPDRDQAIANLLAGVWLTS